jgi:hypothetical protein
LCIFYPFLSEALPPTVKLVKKKKKPSGDEEKAKAKESAAKRPRVAEGKEAPSSLVVCLGGRLRGYGMCESLRLG